MLASRRGVRRPPVGTLGLDWRDPPVFPKGNLLAVTSGHDATQGPAHARLVLADGATAWEGTGVPIEGTSTVRFTMPLGAAVGTGALVLTTSGGTQHVLSASLPPWRLEPIASSGPCHSR
jgi:hypothetical protein